MSDKRFTLEYYNGVPRIFDAHEESYYTIADPYLLALLNGMDKNNAQLREKVEKLEWVAKRIEFIEEYPAEESLCPICRGEKPTHYEDCELDAALQK